MDGYLKIKTKIDNSEIDKDVQALENKIKKLQEDNSNASKEQSSLQSEIDNYTQLCQKADEYKQKIKELKNQKINFNNQFGGNIPNSQLSNYNSIQSQLEEINRKYKNATIEIDKQSPKIDKVYAKLEKVKIKQSQNNAKISEFKQKIEQIKLNKIQDELDSVGKNIQSNIGKLGKMAMAVIGIRTAWGAVRSAVSMASQYNAQIATDFEYMRYCIANLVMPAVQSLIKLLYTVLGYVNAIANAWFGINLFGNASVKNFQKMQGSAGSTAKSAKEIQKSLQGFDEMNVLQDNSSGESSGVTAPNMDLSGIQGEVPAWLQWILDNKDIIIGALAGIAGGLIALKLGFSGIQALGIGIAIIGIIDLVKNIMEFIEDPTWENFSNILLSLSVVLAGIALILRRDYRCCSCRNRRYDSGSSFHC